MKKIAIIAILAIVLVACAPIMPARNQTTNATENATIETNQTVEETPPANETITEEPTPAPDLKDVPVKEATEGELVDFPSLKAVDPDGDPITYSFTSPLNEKGEWQTEVGDAGDHMVTITASDGTNTVSQQILIRVNLKNKAPVIELEEPVSATEGETFTITPTVTDPDGDEVTVTYSGWMTNDTIEIGFDDGGLHKVIITASDGQTTATKEVIVSVENGNRAPELADIAPIMIKEGQKATIKANADDPDGDTVTITYDFPFDDAGVWQSEVGDAGEYEVLVTASDGELEAETTVMVTLESVNRPPVIVLESPIVVQEGDTVTLSPEITDNEGDEVRVSYSGWMTANTKETGYGDSGNHKVEIVARDTAGNEERLEIIVSVEDVNRPPIFGAGSFN
jgi:hypothetical protein